MPANAPALAPAAARPAGRFVAHPAALRWLRGVGVRTAADALALRGEVVCGHPDRHVARVDLGGRTVFLKREHLIPVRTRVRNWLDGFGLVSRCEREALTLRRLAAARLPAPGWLAHGTHAGRAFLLVDGVADAPDLPALLAAGVPDPRLLAERLGRELADTHAAGFGTPELAAKHLLVGRRTHAVTLLDWQSAPAPGPVPVAARARQLAALHATLPGPLASDADRRRLLWAYRRVWQRTADAPRFGPFARLVQVEAVRLGQRSTVRDQLRPAGPAQRLVWLAGEAACVVPGLVGQWPARADGPPFYGPPPTAGEDYPLADGRSAVLVRFRTVDPLGRLRAAVRERPWRSPAAVAARTLFHLERFGLPGPRLLAFGQKLTGPATADSFLLYAPAGSAADGGDLLARLHAADLVLSGPGPWVRAGAVASPLAVRLCKRPSARRRRRDVRLLAGG